MLQTKCCRHCAQIVTWVCRRSLYFPTCLFFLPMSSVTASLRDLTEPFLALLFPSLPFVCKLLITKTADSNDCDIGYCMEYQLSWLSWLRKIVWSVKICLSVCLCVNQGCTNHSRYTFQKIGQSDLVYWVYRLSHLYGCTASWTS